MTMSEPGGNSSPPSEPAPSGANATPPNTGPASPGLTALPAASLAAHPVAAPTTLKATEPAAQIAGTTSAQDAGATAAQNVIAPPAQLAPAPTQIHLGPRPAACPATQNGAPSSARPTASKTDKAAPAQLPVPSAVVDVQPVTPAAATAIQPKAAPPSAPKAAPPPASKAAPPSAPKVAQRSASKPAPPSGPRPAPPTTAAAPGVQRPLGSISLEIARMVTAFLGPDYRRRDSVGATLNALRTRLETSTAKFDSDREMLIWQVREAIRTEFFKIIYPAPPSPMLLSLVTRTEVLLTKFYSENRPFFFPGARVAVPTEAGSRRAGTTLQLRFKVVGEATVTEALLHLDGPNGGGFQWVQTPALTPLVTYAPVQTTPAATPRRIQQQKPITPRPKRGGKATVRAPRPKVPKPPGVVSKRKAQAAKAAAKAAAAAAAKAAATAKKQLEAPPPPPTPTGPAALPPTYVPEALLSTSPPPRKRLRRDVDRPLSHVAGSLRRALDIDASSGEMAYNSIGSIRRLIGIERLVARRKISGSEDIEYFVKWSGRSMREGSWERRQALMVDVPALVVDFDTRHSDEPQLACHSDRIKTEEEEREAETKPEEEVGAEEEAETKEEREEENHGEAKSGDDDVKMEEVEEIIKQDGEPESTKVSPESERKYVDEVTGIAIPGYLDTPVLELGFAGMVLQVRRPAEWSLHNDASALARDYKKRQSRFKQEDIREGEKLFPLSKTEAKSALDASLRSHKTYNRRPIPFPRGLGRAVASDTGTPFSREVLAAAPPTWESYLLGLGLKPKHLERELPPLMLSLDSKTMRRVVVAAKDGAHERAVEHRERARRVVRAAYRHAANTDPPSALFRDGRRRPEECDTCFPAESKTNAKKTKSPRVPEPTTNGLLRARDPSFAAALAAAAAKAKGTQANGDKEERWFDAVWSCWRVGPGPSVQ